MLILNKVSFKYPDSQSHVFIDLSALFSKGWTGVIGANGSGKSTLLKIIANKLHPTNGSVSIKGMVYYLDQRTDHLPLDYETLLNSYDKKSFQLLDSLQIDQSWFSRWESLSHGERKRCQIAVALFHDTDILLVDEPTNHIDSECRLLLLNTLKKFNGIGLIVSHDRDLLNELTTTILSLEENEKQLNPIKKYQKKVYHPKIMMQKVK